MGGATLDRRVFIRNLALTGGSLAGAGLLTSCAGEEHLMSHDAPVLGARTGTTTRYPLHVPATVSPSGLTLEAAPGTLPILPGKSTPVWRYSGNPGGLYGPTIVANAGDNVAITYVNRLPQASIVHWHGVLPPPASDGHPRQAVAANGGSYAYAFSIAQRAALDWYHPHPHMYTGEQVYRGLAGAFILRDATDTGVAGNPLGLPFGKYEVPLIVRDASFDSSGNFQFSNKSSGFWGNTPLVNGTFSPKLDVDKAVYRFRLLNGCNARVLRLALSSGAAFTLIGNDGGLLDVAASVTEITAAPGERFDLLVDFRGLAAGTSVLLRDLDATWDVLAFVGTGATAGTGAGVIPAGTLSSISPLAGPTTPTRTFSFDGMTRINGKIYDMANDGFSVPLNTTELWRFVTNGNGPHPVHVHGVQFQVQRRIGGRGTLCPWERGWKDTVLVNDGETVDVLVRFSAHTGQFIMHCHQLAHEDAGMMANFKVV
jgi:FtsP/CotA-like multicopper oxidase with cupredoxin domain